MPLTVNNLPAHLSLEFRAPVDLLKQGDVALPFLFDWNAKENPNYPLFIYHDAATATNEYITYSTANEAIDRAARYIKHSVGTEVDALKGSPVVGILANTGMSSNSPTSFRSRTA